MKYISIKDAVQTIINTESAVARELSKNAYGYNQNLSALADRQNEIISILKTAPTKEIVHCRDCANKRAVQRKDGMIWRCPHRTGDVKMEGYCESGVRA